MHRGTLEIGSWGRQGRACVLSGKDGVVGAEGPGGAEDAFSTFTRVAVSTLGSCPSRYCVHCPVPYPHTRKKSTVKTSQGKTLHRSNGELTSYFQAVVHTHTHTHTCSTAAVAHN